MGKKSPTKSGPATALPKDPQPSVDRIDELAILLSVIAGTGAFVVAPLPGGVLIAMLSDNEATVIEAVIGAFYVPYFLCGMFLVQIRGFVFPRMLVPICALLALNVMTLFSRGFTYSSVFEDPRYYLPVFSIFFALAGCLISQRYERFRHRRDANRK